MKYDKHYFIAKFSAIPEELFCTRNFVRPDGRKCAFGHCGVETWQDLYTKAEASALRHLFRSEVGLAMINDGEALKYQQATPKLRVLAALNDLPDFF